MVLSTIDLCRRRDIHRARSRELFHFADRYILKVYRGELPVYRSAPAVMQFSLSILSLAALTLTVVQAAPGPSTSLTKRCNPYRQADVPPADDASCRVRVRAQLSVSL